MRLFKSKKEQEKKDEIPRPDITEELMRRMQYTMNKDLIIYMDRISIVLSTYSNALNGDHLNEDEQKKIQEDRRETYERAAAHYLKLLEFGHTEAGSGPAIPFFIAVAYFMCYLQSEMNKTEDWSKYCTAIIDIKNTLMESMSAYVPPPEDTDVGYA